VTRSHLVLATQSPRRIRLVSALGIPFRLLHVRFREHVPGLPAEEAARLIAWRKAETASRTVGRGIVVTADTIVALDGILLGKPRSRPDAVSMLAHLSGRTHEVVTAVALQDARTGCGMLGSERSLVTFRRLNRSTINRYVDTGEPMDKAGGYGIQGDGRKLIARIRGDYFNVVGFPLRLFAVLGARFGLRIPARRIEALYKHPPF
jgi:septum formation protein